ncbi:MAG: tRNA (cytidine(34)-2'-O)-methyltransferase [Alphaproteobacteria bacterium]|nr:tRNA (cytidine(34)-2'-O)-methyltransferase [Alphaproteobacteria bacterium]OJV47060.1 MAG: hypothetical protein BGO28_01265 [Alphaproteobacteria bacterium 43-37]
MKRPEIALYQPEIPPNTGTLIRLSSCLGVALHIIHPCGFVWSDKQLVRSGLDYHDLATVIHHANFSQFLTSQAGKRVLPFDPKGQTPHVAFSYTNNDVLLFGQESCGFPNDILASFTHIISIPMLPGSRSLNLALATSIAVGEALRQTNSFYQAGENL